MAAGLTFGFQWGAADADDRPTALGASGHVSLGPSLRSAQLRVLVKREMGK